MRRALTSHEPSALDGSLPSKTTFASVMLSDAEPPSAFERVPSRFSTSSSDDRRSPHLGLNPPVASSKREMVSRVERAGQSEQSIRIVDFDAVRDRQILVGRAAADRDATAELFGRRHARKGLQGAEHVVERTRCAQHFG